MAGKRKKPRAPQRPKTAREAGYIDVTEWAEKDTAGAYAPGTTFTIGGKQVRPGDVPDRIGGRAPARGAKPPQPR